MRKRPLLLALTLVYLIASAPLFVSAADMADEYVLKSVFLEGLSRFVTWPASSGMSDSSQPFVIGVIGKNPFGKILHNAYQEKKIKDKKVELRYFTTPEQITDCHILFISSSCKGILNEILALTRNRPILTVGDTDGYARKGVLINLYIAENKIRFIINESQFKRASLAVDSILLRIAKVVDLEE